MGKTAVVIIHGVGEQRPMGTVRAFVTLFAGRFFRSKPDARAELFELRRLDTFSSHEDAPLKEALKAVPGYPPDTVFYEYYWAFHYRDTKLKTVVPWSRRTVVSLFRTGQFRVLGRRVINVVLACLVAVIVLLVAMFLIAWGVYDLIGQHQDPWLAIPKILVGAVLPKAFGLVQPFVLGWAGDAARYLGTSPEDPIERQEIRSKGVDLLDRLHQQLDSKGNLEYDRIVLVGHSLGSAIAYDILTFYWAKVAYSIKIDPALPALRAIDALTSLAPFPTAADRSWEPTQGAPAASAYRAAQRDLITALGTKIWRVTDLITLGSPLTYARSLLADGGGDLRERQHQRELPTCPPVKDEHADKSGLRSFVFNYAPVSGANTVVPNAAAPFLLTRWTNMYFPQDPIGGPLRPVMGWGIRDIPIAMRRGGMRTVAGAIADMFGGAHVRYWQLLNDDPNQPLSPMGALRLRAMVREF